MRMGDETQIERLRALLAACHDVLPHLEGAGLRDDDPVVGAIRQTCNEIEARLRLLVTAEEV